MIHRLSSACALLLCLFAAPAWAQSDGAILDFLTGLESDQNWTQLSRTPLKFPVYHPQGMTRVGDDFFMSSVEVLRPTEPLERNSATYDRTPGEGIGHLFKFNSQGDLLAHTTLGEGSIYHPGGIDYDGESIWVPVAEYRPDSRSIIYRVDPENLEATEVMRFADHIGAVAYDADEKQLYGASWGSRYLYEWRAIGDSVANSLVSKSEKQFSDVDYQDCQLLNHDRLLCSGISRMAIDNTHTLTIGGLELLNTNALLVVHKIRITGTGDARDFLTRNPFYFEMTPQGRGLFYFVPEGDIAALYLYSPAAL